MNTLMRLSSAAAALAILLVGCRATGGEPDPGVVVKCGVALGLEPTDNLRRDWSGETRGWWAETADDTLRLVRRGRCGDECNFEEEIVFLMADSCPRFLRASSARVESGSPIPGAGGKVVEARRGTLEIEAWRRAPLLIVGRLSAEFSATFYLDPDAEDQPTERVKDKK